MVANKYFEEFIIGESRETGGRTITEEDITIHAAQTGDYFPHHMDAEWCATQPFKKRMAHGTLVFSIAVGLTANAINELAMTYGYEHIRFIKPVFIGDTLSVIVSIKNKAEYKKPEFGLVTELVETFNQNNDLVMCCEHLLLTQKKDILINSLIPE